MASCLCIRVTNRAQAVSAMSYMQANGGVCTLGHPEYPPMPHTNVYGLEQVARFRTRVQRALGVGFSMAHLGDHVRITLSGGPTLDQFLAFLEMVAVDSAHWSARALLVDLRGVSTLRGFTDQLTMGEAAARQLGHLEKVASLVPEDRVTHNSERVALRAGLNLRVVTDEAEAVAWLQGEAAASAPEAA
jgi:hypothetical protein